MTKLLDCTVRDGGYVNDWQFTRNFVEALHCAVSDSGCAYTEIGFFNPGAPEECLWRNCSADLVVALKALRPGGAGVAVMIDYGSYTPEQVPYRTDYPVDLIRVAVAKKDRAAGTEFAARLNERGHSVTVNYMAITEYTDAELTELAALMGRYVGAIKYFYVADSFGSLLPSRARQIFSQLRAVTSAPLGFHPHNNLQLAFANTLEAIDAGIDIVDGSIMGMGRGAGNLFLEAALAYLEKTEAGYRLLPVLRFADLFADALKAKWTWGYSLPQLISGILSCHPNYPTNLMAEKQYTADVIYHLLGKLRPESRSRYSKSVTEELKRDYVMRELRNSPHFVSAALQKLIASRRGVLLLAGGISVSAKLVELRCYAEVHSLLTVAINNPVRGFAVDAYLFANRRRLLQNLHAIGETGEVIFTQAIHAEASEQFGLSSVSWLNVARNYLEGEQPFASIVPTNSTIEAILGFAALGVAEIKIAGLDGFGVEAGKNYHDSIPDSEITEAEAARRNAVIETELAIAASICSRTGTKFTIITPTAFKKYSEEVFK